jgi:hypothetical protein
MFDPSVKGNFFDRKEVFLHPVIGAPPMAMISLGFGAFAASAVRRPLRYRCR